MKKLTLILSVSLVLFACSDSNKIPKDILPREKMQAVLWSMINAGEYLSGYVLKDSVDKVAASLKVYGKVFQIHNITKEEFERSYSYYQRHPELMKAILDSLSKRQNFAVEKVQRHQDSARRKILKVDTAQ